jgi:hypothetical protein
VPWLRGIVVWILIILVESVHGTLRQLFLAPAIGDFHARQVAVFSGIALIFLIAALTIRWVAVRNFSESLLVGALWVALTVAFEVALGRVILGYDWSRILEDYDLSRGGLMGLGLLAMLFTPAAAARIRRRQPQR